MHQGTRQRARSRWISLSSMTVPLGGREIGSRRKVGCSESFKHSGRQTPRTKVAKVQTVVVLFSTGEKYRSLIHLQANKGATVCLTRMIVRELYFQHACRNNISEVDRVL